MRSKHPGKCSNCRTEVTPKIHEENSVRRDICQCPTCNELILVCRTPGCDNYAKSGEIYDDELCFECTAALGDVALSSTKNIIGAAVAAIGAAVAGAAASKTKNTFD